MFYVEGAPFRLFLGGPVLSLRSFRTKDVTAHNHPKYAHQKQKKSLILQQNILKLVGKLIWYSEKTRVLRKIITIATKC